jgi:hypothetical protein
LLASWFQEITFYKQKIIPALAGFPQRKPANPRQKFPVFAEQPANISSALGTPQQKTRQRAVIFLTGAFLGFSRQITPPRRVASTPAPRE